MLDTSHYRRRHGRGQKYRRIAAAVAGLLAVGACSEVPVEHSYPYEGARQGGGPQTYKGYEDYQAKRKTLFGDGGLFGGGKEGRPTAGGGGLGVNSYLWRASLDTIAFMPVTSADPFGGVIITDWHSMSQSPSERFKLNVYILDQALRADGVRVAVFRQVLDQTGGWRDSALPDQTSLAIENAILTRARQLRNETAAQ